MLDDDHLAEKPTIYNLYVAQNTVNLDIQELWRTSKRRLKYAMPRISTVVVFRATFALVLFILMGQILLFALTRCKGLGDDELNSKNHERQAEIPTEKLSSLMEKIRLLNLDVENLKQENNALSGVIRDLTARNKDISKRLKRLKNAEKFTIAQELSREKSRKAKGEFLKGQPLRTEFEVVPFDGVAYNAIYQIYHGLSGNPAERPHGHKGKDYLEVMKFAVDALRNYEGRNMEITARDLVDGVMRVDRIIGSQYDFYFRSTNNKVFHRVKIERPFGPLNLAGSIETVDTNNELINLILPLSGRLDKFKAFLDNFVDVCVRWDRSVFLTVVFFGQAGKEELETMMANVSKAENFTDYKLIFSNETFSRGYGLQQGATSWEKGNVLMFFCDVDVLFTSQFLDRCRFYSTPGVKLYYPVVFSLYNPTIVYGGSPPPNQNQFRINRDTGYWRDFGYGMTCQYRNDFIKIGGFDLSIKGWGMEDVKLYRSYLASDLVVIRAADRGIFHTWHPKYCSRNLTQSQFLSCIKSKVKSEASHSQLGLLAFGGKIFDEKETNWIEQLKASKKNKITEGKKSATTSQ